MPLGGSVISWDNTTPPGTESIGLGDDRIRSLKTSVQEFLDNEHNFPSAGGASSGYHRLGSARAHYGTQSRVSSGDTDGRLMVTSDSSRLFGTNSTGTLLFGSPGGISVEGNSDQTFPQRYRWALEFGAVNTGSSGSINISFANSGFSNTPTVVATAVLTASIIVLGTAESSRITIFSYNSGGGVAALAPSVAASWMAIGTRIL